MDATTIEHPFMRSTQSSAGTGKRLEIGFVSSNSVVSHYLPYTAGVRLRKGFVDFSGYFAVSPLFRVLGWGPEHESRQYDA
jgi:hypothetical protein